MGLELSLSYDALRNFALQVLESTFPDGVSIAIDAPLEAAMARIETNFSKVALPGYSREGRPYFNHLHGDQSACFWYLLSNAAFRLGRRQLAEKCMLVNKARNGILIMYDTELPAHFLLIHTVGTMLGKAVYGDYFVATQNVTVGTHKGRTPEFGRGVILYPKAFVAGKTILGDYTRVAAGSTVIDLATEPESVVSGRYPLNDVRPSRRATIGEYFRLA